MEWKIPNVWAQGIGKEKKNSPEANKKNKGDSHGTVN